MEARVKLPLLIAYTTFDQRKAAKQTNKKPRIGKANTPPTIKLSTKTLGVAFQVPELIRETFSGYKNSDIEKENRYL